MRWPRRRMIGWTFLALLVGAVIVVVVLPARDPLRDAETVYVEMPGAEADGSATSEEIRDALMVVLNNRDLRIVADRRAADVALRIVDINLNFGDVEFSVAGGEVRGKAKAVLEVTDLRTGLDHTMDLIVQLRDGTVRASLEAHRFYEFWK